MTEIHPDWDAEKAEAHLAMLRANRDRAEAIYEAFTDAADEHLREADRIRDQIAYCEGMFTKPRRASGELKTLRDAVRFSR